MDIISIGAQCGGPKDGGLGHIKVDLYKALKKSCLSTYCDAIEQYALVLRIDGAIQQFGNEEITRLRFAKKGRYITADIQIPESVWSVKSKNELRGYLALKVKETIELFIKRIKKENIIIDDESLFKDIDAGIQEFMKIDYEKNS